MSRLPNYMVRYHTLLSMCTGIDDSKLCIADMKRKFKMSNSAIYNNVDAIKKDFNAIL